MNQPQAERPSGVGGLAAWLPGLAVARSYRREWWSGDIKAALVVSALLIPAGMGYAEAAGLPPVTGLYATIVPLLVYAVVGPSRILVFGPDSALAPIIAVSIVPLAAGDPERAVTLGALLALMVGAILVVGGLLRLGLVTDLLSKPIRVGYLNGLAVVVVVLQVPKLLGFDIDGFQPVHDVALIATNLGQTNLLACAFGGATLLIVWASRLIDRRVPGVLVALVGSMLVAWLLGLEDKLSFVGALPQGLPGFALGGIRWADVGSLLVPALGIALVAFADTGVLSRTFAARHGRDVDGSQEMRAAGMANLASSLASGFPISASSSRTLVAEQAGARTQLTCVIGALVVLGFMVAAPGVTAYLPTAALAAVVIVAASSLIDVQGFRRILRMSRVDGLLALAAFLGVVLWGVIEGIGVAIALSLVAFVQQAWQPYRAELGLVPGLRGYHDLSRHPEGQRVPGVVILRWDAPLFFANSGLFGAWARAQVESAGSQVHTVILAAEPITGVDTTAADDLVDFDRYLASHGMRLVLAEVKGPVKDLLSGFGLDGRFGPERFAPTVGAAVDDITGEFRADIDPG